MSLSSVKGEAGVHTVGGDGRARLDPDARADLAAHASRTIAKGSKSFAAAARLFDGETRRSAMMLYAWCRHCDDTVDGQDLGFAREAVPQAAGLAGRVDYLEAETLAALAGRETVDPGFAAIADVAARHGISADLLFEHLAGYRMDAGGHVYETFGETLTYCYHVAGAVGVMMAKVMGQADEGVLDRACDLGIAFQLTNIARDIVEDAGAGRVYLPATWLREEALSPDEIADPARREAVSRLAVRLVEAAEPYYVSASGGLAALPPRSALAVATAHGVYRRIGLLVKARGASAWDGRVRTGKGGKLVQFGQGVARVAASRLGPVAPRPPHLWTRARDL